MKCLLDVNALVALGFRPHEFHDRVSDWIVAQGLPELLTCSITELGFVRVLAQTPTYGLTVEQARALLLKLKKANSLGLRFVSDSEDISHLPKWVKTPHQITDGHLAELAIAHGAVLATLDERIPAAYLIPR